MNRPRNPLASRLLPLILSSLVVASTPACVTIPYDFSVCASDADCPQGTCSADGHCEACSEGACVAAASCTALGCDAGTSLGCTNDADCGPAHTCNGGACASAPTCTLNSDCAASEVCHHGTCTLVGACISDAHCGCGAPSCVDHQCVGESTCGGSATGDPIACAITADCPHTYYCVEGQCAFATECLQHADCPPDEACFHSACWVL